MNLTSEPWIPALLADGTAVSVSLGDAFARGRDIRDLSVAPHERIAIMRLLVAIAQAAFDGPDDDDGLHACSSSLPDLALAYLDRWKSSFELFGDGPRFLQVPGVVAANEEGAPASKLDVMLSSGNNHTIFDMAAAPGRSIPPSRMALNLVSFQCFSPGGQISLVSWKGKDTGRTSTHAPCLPANMLHCIVLRPNLLDTIVANLLTRTDVDDIQIPGGWGRPVWEMPVRAPDDVEAIRNATLTYLGRLTPLARAIALSPEGASVALGMGLDYPPFPEFREAAATVIMQDEKLKNLSFRPGTEIWRNLSSLAVKRHLGAGGPPALARSLAHADAAIWVGALSTDKSKILDSVGGVYVLPCSLQDPQVQQSYEACVRHAERVGSALWRAVATYHEDFKSAKTPTTRAARDYWTALGQHLPVLFKSAADFLGDERMPDSEWARIVRATALSAFDRVCTATTPRHMRAYVKSRSILTKSNGAPKKGSSAKTINRPAAP